MSSRPRPAWLFPALALIVTLIVIETLAWTVFARMGEDDLFGMPHRAPLGEASARAVERQFDAELGWRKPHDTRYGERPRGRDFGRPLMAVFGDSFAYGQEVADPETWSEHLAQLFEGDVYNFGNGAYGMDQALLLFERERARRPTPIAIFAFISQDAHRNLRAYREFVVQDTSFYLTKPRFALAGDELVALPNPARDGEHLRGGLGDPALWRHVAEHDWRYRRYWPAQALVPRFLRFLVPGFWRAVADRRRVPDPWRLAEPRRLAERILLRFHHGALDTGTVSLIVHLPSRPEVRAYLLHKAVPAAVETTRELCANHDMRCLFPLFALGSREQGDVPAMFARHGHYSPEANRWLAHYLHQRLAPLVAGARAGRKPGEADLAPTGSGRTTAHAEAR